MTQECIRPSNSLGLRPWVKGRVREGTPESEMTRHLNFDIGDPRCSA